MASQIVLDDYLWQGKTLNTTVAYLPTSPASVGAKLLMPVSEWTIYVTFDHTSAAGVVLVETAPSADYAGTWTNVATVTWSAIDKCHTVSVSAIYRAIRVKIGTAVTSGTCDVYVIGMFN